MHCRTHDIQSICFAKDLGLSIFRLLRLSAVVAVIPIAAQAGSDDSPFRPAQNLRTWVQATRSSAVPNTAKQDYRILWLCFAKLTLSCSR